MTWTDDGREDHMQVSQLRKAEAQMKTRERVLCNQVRRCMPLRVEAEAVGFREVYSGMLAQGDEGVRYLMLGLASRHGDRQPRSDPKLTA